MRFFRRDLQNFNIMELVLEEDTDGYKVNNYQKTNRFIRGNIQPLSGDKYNEIYGIDLKYIYEIYADKETNVKEGEALLLDENLYRIETIERWSSHIKIIVKEVENGL